MSITLTLVGRLDVFNEVRMRSQRVRHIEKLVAGTTDIFANKGGMRMLRFQHDSAVGKLMEGILELANVIYHAFVWK